MFFFIAEEYSCEELTHWKRLWCWEGLGAGGEGDDRGWDGWMASLTQWTWVWVNSGSWWWTGRPGVLQSMGSQRVGHDWATELNCLFHCVYVPQLPYPFVCQWTAGLLPWPSYCKQWTLGYTCLFQFWNPASWEKAQFSEGGTQALEQSAWVCLNSVTDKSWLIGQATLSPYDLLFQPIKCSVHGLQTLCSSFR